MLNGQLLTARTTLKGGDRIMAGNLILICDGGPSHNSTSSVVDFTDDRIVVKRTWFRRVSGPGPRPGRLGSPLLGYQP
jgi:hypothetical protein